MKEQEILLIDPQIRDWVLLPLFVLVVLMGIGRQYLQIVIKSDPQPPTKPSADESPIGAPEAVKTGTFKDMGEIRYKQTCMSAARLRVNGKYISSDSFHKRQRHLTREKTGVLEEKAPPAANPAAAMMSGNSSGMMDMMKGQVLNYIPWMGMMSVCNYFFSGFVIMKVPFSLPSNKFKEMLQQRIDLRGLDVSYVSSLAFFFILNFGLNGVYQLLLGGDSEIDGASMIQMQMGGMGMAGGMPGQPGFDAGKALASEREMVKIATHTFIGDDVEKTLLGDRFPKLQSQAQDLSGMQ